MFSVDEMKLLLADDDKLQELLASRVDEVNDVQQKIVLFLEKFASQRSSLCCVTSLLHYSVSDVESEFLTENLTVDVGDVTVKLHNNTSLPGEGSYVAQNQYEYRHINILFGIV